MCTKHIRITNCLDSRLWLWWEDSGEGSISSKGGVLSTASHGSRYSWGRWRCSMPQLPIPEHQTALLAFISLNQLLFFSIRGMQRTWPPQNQENQRVSKHKPQTLTIKPHYLEGLDDDFFVSLLVTARFIKLGTNPVTPSLVNCSFQKLWAAWAVLQRICTYVGKRGNCFLGSHHHKT